MMCKLKSLIFLLKIFIKLNLLNFIKCDNNDLDLVKISNEIFKSLNNHNNYNHYNNKPSFNQSCINYCIGKNEVCNTLGLCECKSYYEFNEYFDECVICPGFGEFCSNGCCGHNSLQCINNRCIVAGSKTGVFMTASQIALSAALIMAIAALIMVIYRLCSKPRYLTRRDIESITISRTPNACTSNFLRESLTSMQIRILSRLRDRPPTYDEINTSTRHNNNNNSNNNNSNNTQRTISTIPIVQNIPEAPPPYEVEREMSIVHQPPPYSEVIISPANLNNTNREGQTINNNLTNSSNVVVTQVTNKLSEKDENQVEISSKLNL